MKTMKLLTLTVVGIFAVAMAVTSAASATTLELPTGSTLSAAAEGTTILHASAGNIECGASTVEGKTSNEGGSTETVQAKVETLSFSSCGAATITVLALGSLEIHTRNEAADGNGTLTSSGTEVTAELSGLHCIFKTNGTDIGTLTGSANTAGNATLDIEATIPRTGGRSGAFCGSTAKWTGSYKVSSPSVVNVDDMIGLSLSAPPIHAGEEKNLSAVNTGNIDWTVVNESLAFDSGSWDLAKDAECFPKSRAPGTACILPLKCTTAGTMTWTVKVEAANKMAIQKTLTVTCEK